MFCLRHEYTALFDASHFLPSRKYPDFESMTEEAICARPFWGEFAKYLEKDHICETGKSKNKNLAAGTALQYMSVLMNMAAAKYRHLGTDKTKLFFTEVFNDNTSEAGKWWFRLTGNLSRVIYQRTKRAGEDTDQSATPVYGEHFRGMVRSIFIGEVIVTLRSHHFPSIPCLRGAHWLVMVQRVRLLANSLLSPGKLLGALRRSGGRHGLHSIGIHILSVSSGSWCSLRSPQTSLCVLSRALQGTSVGFWRSVTTLHWW